MECWAKVLTDPLSVERCMSKVQHEGAGAVVPFVGVVRANNEGRVVTLLEYDAYVSMAEKELARIVDELQSRFDGVRLSVEHRIGPLHVGDAAVIAVASAPHRHEAFVASRELIDQVKARVPIWKREHGPDGAYWVGWQDARCVGHAHS